MSRGDKLAAFARALGNHESYVVVGHVNPDPDCLGTMLAVGGALQKMGKKVTIVSPDPVPAGLRFLPGAETIQIPPAPKAEVLLVVDCDLPRTGAVAEQKDQFEHVYNLDHHITNDARGPKAFVDPGAAATGEIALELLADHWVAELDPDTVFNLYAAIMTDTGGFRFGNTTASTLRAAARLVDAGAKPGHISSAVYESVSWPSFQLLRTALQSLSRTEDGRVAWIVLTRAMMEQCGAGDEDSVGLAQYPRMLDGVDVSMLLREQEDGKTRVSLRAKGSHDVSAVAERFGGGGHPGAAGCTVDLPPGDVLPLLLDAVQQMLSPAGRGGDEGASTKA